jgi:four helix bundle protein
VTGVGVPTITRFEESEAWKTARELTRLIRLLTKQDRFVTDWGLRNQIQRAAVSVMSNIDKGSESRTQAQFLEYRGRVKASAGEVRSQLYVALDLEYISQNQFDQALDLADKASRHLFRFMQYLETHPQSRGICEAGAQYEV